MISPTIGLVIPIVQRKYIIGLIKQIRQTVQDSDVIICVVNDGNNKIINYLKKNLPRDVELLNLKQNLCFAGANNAGWKLLVQRYPNIKYLGTINDDTIPQNNWLHVLVDIMDNNSNVGACSPVMITNDNNLFNKKVKYSSTWKLGISKHPMVIDKHRITKDTYVKP